MLEIRTDPVRLSHHGYAWFVDLFTQIRVSHDAHDAHPILPKSYDYSFQLSPADICFETSYTGHGRGSNWSRPEYRLCRITRIPDRAASTHKESIVPRVLIGSHTIFGSHEK
jgi:hypothetical protein